MFGTAIHNNTVNLLNASSVKKSKISYFVYQPNWSLIRTITFLMINWFYFHAFYSPFSLNNFNKTTLCTTEFNTHIQYIHVLLVYTQLSWTWCSVSRRSTQCTKWSFNALGGNRISTQHICDSMTNNNELTTHTVHKVISFYSLKNC